MKVDRNKHLLSGQVPVAETPEQVEFIATVAATDSDDALISALATLDEATLDEQTDLCCWVDVLDKVDTTLTTLITDGVVLVREQTSSDTEGSAREQVEALRKQLRSSDYGKRVQDVESCVRFLSLLLRNSRNRQVFNSLEQLDILLSAEDERLELSAMEAIHAVVTPTMLHRHPNGDQQLDTVVHHNKKLFKRLLILSKGWGSKPQGMGLKSCLCEETDKLPVGGADLFFEFYSPPAASSNKPGLTTIQIDRLGFDRSGDKSIVEIFLDLVETYNVPVKYRFALLQQIRLACDFGSKEGRTRRIKIRLMAITSMLCANTDTQTLMSYFSNETELAGEMVELMQPNLTSNSTSPAGVPIDISIHAISALEALSVDWDGNVENVLGQIGLQAGVLQALGTIKGSPHGIFSSIIRAAVAYVESDWKVVPSLEPEEPVQRGAASPVPASQPLSEKHQDDCIRWTEAILSLTTAVVGDGQGVASLADSGLVSTMLSVLEGAVKRFSSNFEGLTRSQQDAWVYIVALSSYALEGVISAHSASARRFRELGGVKTVVAIVRAQLQVGIARSVGKLLEPTAMAVQATDDSKPDEAQVKDDGRDNKVEDDNETNQNDSSGAANESKTDAVFKVHHPKVEIAQGAFRGNERALLHVLFHNMSTLLHSNGGSGQGSVDGELRDPDSVLAQCLKIVFDNSQACDGTLFSLAALFLHDILNSDPACASIVISSGLASSVLQVITNRHLKDDFMSVCGIPQVMGALSLNPQGEQAVKKSDSFEYLFEILRSPDFTKPKSLCLSRDNAVLIGGHVDELLRHSPSMRPRFLDACVAALQALIDMGQGFAAEELPEELLKQEEPRRKLYWRYITQTVLMITQALEHGNTSKEFADKGGFKLLFQLYKYSLSDEVAYLITNTQRLIDTSSSTKKKDEHHKSTSYPAANSLFLALHGLGGLSTVISVLISEMIDSISKNLAQVVALKQQLSPGCPTPTMEEDSDAIVKVGGNVIADMAESEFMVPADQASVPLADLIKHIPNVRLVASFSRHVLVVEWLLALLMAFVGNTHTHVASMRSRDLMSELTGNKLFVLQLVGKLDAVLRWETTVVQLNRLQHQRRTAKIGDDKMDEDVAGGDQPIHSEETKQRGDTSDETKDAASEAKDSATETKPAISLQTLMVGEFSRYNSTFLTFLQALGHAFIAPRHRGNSESSDSVLMNHAKKITLEICSVFKTYLAIQAECKRDGMDKDLNSKSVACAFNGQLCGMLSELFFDRNKKAYNFVLLIEMDKQGLVDEVLDVVQGILLAAVDASDPELQQQARLSMKPAVTLLDLLLEDIPIYRCHQVQVIRMLQDEMPNDWPLPEDVLLEVHFKIIERMTPFFARPEIATLDDNLVFAVLNTLLLMNRVETSNSQIFKNRFKSDAAGTIGPPWSSRFSARGRSSREGGEDSGTFVPDFETTETIVMMGFPSVVARHAQEQTRSNQVEVVTEWILSHVADLAQLEQELTNKDADEASDSADGDAQGEASQVDEEEEKRKAKVLEKDKRETSAMERIHETGFTACMLLVGEMGKKNRATDLMASTNLSSEVQKKIIARVTVIWNSMNPRYFAVDRLVASLGDAIDNSAKEDRLLLDHGSAFGFFVQCFAKYLHQLEQIDPAKCFDKGVPVFQDQYVRVLNASLRAFKLLETSENQLMIGQENAASWPSWIEPCLLLFDVAMAKVSFELNFRSGTTNAANAESAQAIVEKRYPEVVSFFDLANRRLLLNFCLRFLRKEPPSGVLHAILLLTAQLVKDSQLGYLFFDDGGVDAVLSLPSASRFPGHVPLMCVIMTRVLEDQDTLKSSMRSALVNAFRNLEKSRSPVKLKNLLKDCKPLIQRDFGSFQTVLSETVVLSQASGSSSEHVVTLREAANENKTAGAADSSTTPSTPKSSSKRRAAAYKTPPTKVPSTPFSGMGAPPASAQGRSAAIAATLICATVDGLVNQKANVVGEEDRNEGDTKMDTTDDKLSGVTLDDKSGGHAKKDGDNQVVVKQRFFSPLHCVVVLTELLAIFPAIGDSVVKFSNASFKKQYQQALGKGNLPVEVYAACERSFLVFLFHVVLTHMEHSPSPAKTPSNKRTKPQPSTTLGRAGRNLLTMLAVRKNEGRVGPLLVNELVAACQLCCRRFTEKSVSESQFLFSIQAWCDLALHLLAPRQEKKKQHSTLSWDVARCMVDKRLDLCVTSALELVDMSHPRATNVANALLRPMEVLTRADVVTHIRRLLSKANQGSSKSGKPHAGVKGTPARYMGDEASVEVDQSVDTFERTQNDGMMEMVWASHNRSRFEWNGDGGDDGEDDSSSSSNSSDDDEDDEEDGSGDEEEEAYAEELVQAAMEEDDGDASMGGDDDEDDDNADDEESEDESDDDDDDDAEDDEAEEQHLNNVLLDEFHNHRHALVSDSDSDDDETENEHVQIDMESDDDEEVDDRVIQNFGNRNSEGEIQIDLANDFESFVEQFLGNIPRMSANSGIGDRRGMHVVNLAGNRLGLRQGVTSPQEAEQQGHMIPRAALPGIPRIYQRYSRNTWNRSVLSTFGVFANGNTSNTAPMTTGVNAPVDIFLGSRGANRRQPLQLNVGAVDTMSHPLFDATPAVAEEGSGGRPDRSANPMVNMFRREMARPPSRRGGNRQDGAVLHSLGDQESREFTTQTSSARFEDTLNSSALLSFIVDEVGVVSVPEEQQVAAEEAGGGEASGSPDDEASGSRDEATDAPQEQATTTEVDVESAVPADTSQQDQTQEPTDMEQDSPSEATVSEEAPSGNSEQDNTGETATSTSEDVTAPAQAGESPPVPPQSSASAAQEGDENAETEVDDELAEALRLSMANGGCVETETSQDNDGAGGVETATEAASPDTPNEGVAEAATEDSTAIAAEAAPSATTEEATEPGVVGDGEAAGGEVIPPGVDPEVWASLPDDVKNDILSQHGMTTTSSAEETPENAEFLAAMPEDIRQEILNEQERERQAAAAEAAADPSLAQEMDTASFIATLTDPALRHDILLSTPLEVIATLPSHLRAEAMLLRQRHDTNRHRARQGHSRSIDQSTGGESDNNQADAEQDNVDVEPKPPSLELALTDVKGRSPLENQSIFAIIRLLYVVRPLRKNLLQSLLWNMIQNAQSRQVVVDTLLYLLASFEQCRPMDSPAENWPPRHLFVCPTESNMLLSIVTRSASNTHELGDYVVPPPLVSTRILDILQHLLKKSNRLLKLFLEESSPKRDCGDRGRLSPLELILTMLSLREYNLSSLHLDRMIALLSIIVEPLKELKALEDAKKEASKVAKASAESPAEGSPQEQASSNGGQSEGATTDAESKATELEQQQAASKKTDKEEDKEPKVEEYVIPWRTVAPQQLRYLAEVLLVDNCSEGTFDKATTVVNALSSVPGNREILLKELLRTAETLGQRAVSDLAYLKGIMQNSDFSEGHKSNFLLASDTETKLLRILKTMNGLADSNPDALRELCRGVDLQSLWGALSECLAIVSERNPGTGLDDSGPDAENAGEAAGATSNAPARDEDEMDEDEEDEDDEDGDEDGPKVASETSISSSLGRFLPMIEAFFIMNGFSSDVKSSWPAASQTVTTPTNKELVKSEDDQAAKGDFGAKGDPAAQGGQDAQLLSFVHDNEVILNTLVRQTPALLDSSLKCLIKHPKCRSILAFDNKRGYFRAAMKKMRQDARREMYGTVRMIVRRDYVFEDSFHQLTLREAEELRGRLSIVFQGEEGIDAGGVTREWYSILAREIFKPGYCLFKPSADSSAFQPDPRSYIVDDHLKYFKFVGRVVGKSIADGHLLDAHFTRSFYKHILGIPVTYHDIQSVDPQYYNSLMQLLQYNIDDLGLELSFIRDVEEFGVVKTVELKPGGADIAVHEGNKLEFVKLATKHRMTTGIRQQIDSFLEGFYELVPHDLINIFNEQELELLISGVPEIDLVDLKANTEYVSYTAASNQIQWFWNTIESMDKADHARFLMFVTGTSKVPLEGFKALVGMRGLQRFSIHKAYGGENTLPSAHTCFNQLDLPEYSTEEMLREKLLYAIKEGGEGFGFG